MLVGVIGVGMVGSAMLQTFSEKGLRVFAYDRFRPGFTDEDVNFDDVYGAEFIFVSVPTQTLDSGEQDLAPIKHVLSRLSGLGPKGIVVSRCTTLPGTTRTLQESFPTLKIAHYPEFLRAASAYDDFKYQKIALISGPDNARLELGEFLFEIFNGIKVKLFDRYETTEIAKYAHNCLLATKVAFLNEVFDVCANFGVDYAKMIEATRLIGKIGDSHLSVPGPDGLRGFGGFCFPKDTGAFLKMMENHGINAATLKGAIHSNRIARKE